jgi:hypothetical protein
MKHHAGPGESDAINALAGMGILTDDDGLIDAALSELKSLPLDLRHRRDPRRDFSYILKAAPSWPGKQTTAVPRRRTLAPLLPPRPNHEANHANIEIEMMVILVSTGKYHSGVG